MAAVQMQRWALVLSAYQYITEHVNGKANNCADCKSRLSLSGQAQDNAEKTHVVVQMDDMPVWQPILQKCNKELCIVTTDLSPFCKCDMELSVLDG